MMGGVVVTAQKLKGTRSHEDMLTVGADADAVTLLMMVL